MTLPRRPWAVALAAKVRDLPLGGLSRNRSARAARVRAAFSLQRQTEVAERELVWWRTSGAVHVDGEARDA